MIFFSNELFKIDEVIVLLSLKFSDIVSLDDIYLKILEFQKKDFVILLMTHF